MRSPRLGALGVRPADLLAAALGGRPRPRLAVGTFASAAAADVVLLAGGVLLTRVSTRSAEAPAGHLAFVLNHTVEHGSSGQSAIISGFHHSPILGKPSLATAAATPNPHRRPTAHRCPAGSFFGGFPTPASIPVNHSRRPASETLHVAGPLGRGRVDDRYWHP
jgi:hypothetical protein